MNIEPPDFVNESESHHTRLARELALFWDNPDLALLREELKRFIETVYPSVEEEAILQQAEESEELNRDANSYWECWNYLRGMLSSPHFDAANYWDFGGAVGRRIDDWEEYLQHERRLAAQSK